MIDQSFTLMETTKELNDDIKQIVKIIFIIRKFILLDVKHHIRILFLPTNYIFVMHLR